MVQVYDGRRPNLPPRTVQCAVAEVISGALVVFETTRDVRFILRRRGCESGGCTLMRLSLVQDSIIASERGYGDYSCHRVSSEHLVEGKDFTFGYGHDGDFPQSMTIRRLVVDRPRKLESLDNGHDRAIIGIDGLDRSIKNALLYRGVFTVGDLLRVTGGDLKEIGGFGETRIRKLMRVMQEVAPAAL